jgi:hypothetical protein
MLDLIRDTLSAAVGTGNAVRIIYHGGSQPGSVRDVVPISTSVYELRARDVTSGIAKTFKLAKIELPGEGVSRPKYDPENIPEEVEGTIWEVLCDERPSLEAFGWHVVIEDHCVSLARYFKNGKPRKTPDVQLVYDEYIVEYGMNIDGGEYEHRRKSKRPYRVTSCGFATVRAFGNMSKAVSLFRSEAATHAPSRGGQ